MLILLIGLLTSPSFANTFANPQTTAVPRTAEKLQIEPVIYEGGKGVRSNIEALRYFFHQKDGFERWVFDFSAPGRAHKQEVAPLFQVEYRRANRTISATGEDVQKETPKFVFRFRAIESVFVTPAELARLAKTSPFVEEIVLFPAIEEGDLAVEFVLKHNVSYRLHQPTEKPGRLVLDLSLKAPTT